MTSSVNKIPDAKYVVFENSQRWESGYDDRDPGSYVGCISETFILSDEELRDYLNRRMDKLNVMRVFKITPVPVALSINLDFA